MARESHKLLTLLVACLACAPALSAAPESEAELFTKIKSLHGSGKYREMEERSSEFLKKYPRSANALRVRLLRAEGLDSPAEAMREYRALVRERRSFPAADEAQHHLCEILYLLGRWDECIREAQQGLSLFPDSARAGEMRRLLAGALIYHDRHEEARRLCRDASSSDHSYHGLAASLLMAAHAERKSSADSRAYALSLGELITGFPGAECAPAVLYNLGKYYEGAGDWNRAYSAFIDLLKKFPRSPEAVFAKGRLEKREYRNPSRVSYLPDAARMPPEARIDIRPEYEYDHEFEDSPEISYRVQMGPFGDAARARAIMRLVKRDFEPAEMLRVADRYMVYVGQCDSEAEAAGLKIRLAEELAINGTVVRVRRNGERLYIYGE